MWRTYDSKTEEKRAKEIAEEKRTRFYKGYIQFLKGVFLH
jgi:hypothetical protein